MGSEVTLDASVEDLQDGELPDSSLVWTSDRAGVLGTGEIITVKNLAGGRHIITLTATNSHGLSASASTILNIGGIVKNVSASPAQPAPGASAMITVEGLNPCGAIGLTYDGGPQVVHPITGLPYSEAHTFTTAGVHTVVAIGHGNCLGRATVSITVR